MTKVKQYKTTGWKVFCEEERDGKLVLKAPIQCYEYRTDGWNFAKLDGWKVGEPYLPGFHIFLTKNNAIEYAALHEAVYEVEYKGVLASGVDGDLREPTVSAAAIRIIRKIPKRKTK